jgi:histone H3/H4
MADANPPKEAATIPNAVVKRIMLEAGAERVAGDAVAELGKLLVAHGHALTKKALEAAQHAKRTTIKAEDVTLAGH